MFDDLGCTEYSYVKIKIITALAFFVHNVIIRVSWVAIYLISLVSECDHSSS